jgi:cell division protein FtsB
MTVTVPTSAPTKAPPRPAPEPALLPDANPTERPSGRPRTAAAQRAYARRAQRAGHGPERAEQAVTPGGRARFVVLIIVLLVTGIAATLWLSTQAISDSYRLERAKQESTDLSERADVLKREVSKLDSPSALAQRAKELGMVFPGDPARLVVAPDGTITVVGEPKQAPSQAPPSTPTTSPGTTPPPAGQQPPGDQGDEPAPPAPAFDPDAPAPGAG